LTAKAAAKRFDLFNRWYFEGKLKRPPIRILPAGRAGTLINRCSDWAAIGDDEDGKLLIEIRATTKDVDLSFLYASILHEMVHLSIGWDTSHDHRSKVWNAEVKRLSLAGALKEVL